MTSTAVFLCAPGKGQCAAQIAALLGCSSIVEDWQPGDEVPDGALVLTQCLPGALESVLHADPLFDLEHELSRAQGNLRDMAFDIVRLGVSLAEHFDSIGGADSIGSAVSRAQELVLEQMRDPACQTFAVASLLRAEDREPVLQALRASLRR